MKFNFCFLPILALLPLSACYDASEGDDPSFDCGAKCDAFSEKIEKAKFECDGSLIDRSGRGFLPASLSTDTLFSKVFAKKEGGCPSSFADIIAKMEQFSDKKCTTPINTTTRVISEEAAVFKNSPETSYRTVTSRVCGDEDDSTLLFSMFGWSGDGGGKNPTAVSGNGFPDQLEVASFDTSKGVYNYYKALPNNQGGETMFYFGNSIDFITKGPEQPFLTAVRGCATCHTGGGPVMKELDAPWLHWQENNVGREKLVTSRKQLGNLNFGPDLESVVRSGNSNWNKTRVAFLSKQTGKDAVKKLLAPAFCTNEINIVSGSGGGTVFLPGQAFVDSRFTFINANVPQNVYDAVGKAIGMKVPGTGKPDTVFPFTAFIPGGAGDDDYLDQLSQDGKGQVVSGEFIKAVKLVDFTRPVFSDDRCALLDFAPELAAADRKPDKILKGFIANLKDKKPAKGSPAEQLLGSLEILAKKKNQVLNVDKITDTFAQACTADKATVKVGGKDAPVLVVSLFKLRSLQRQVVFGTAKVAGSKTMVQRKLLEFPNTMAQDNIKVSTAAKLDDITQVHPQARLDPTTCKLTDKFVAVQGTAE